MSARRWARRLLISGGVLSALNGAAHFALPLTYPPGGWEQHVDGLYEPVRWALYATTVFFGVLLVLGGALTVAVARAQPIPERVVGWVMGGMAAFWLLAAAYELVVPFPLDGQTGRCRPSRRPWPCSLPRRPVAAAQAAAAPAPRRRGGWDASPHPVSGRAGS